MSFFTESELLKHLNASGDNASEIVKDINDDAFELLQEITGRCFGSPKTIIKVRSGRKELETLYVPDEIRTLTKVETSPIWSTTWTEEALSEFQFVVGENWIRWRGRSFPEGRKNVRFTYTAGFNPREAPARARRAVIQLIEVWYRNRVTTDGPVDPEEPGRGGRSIPKDVNRLFRLLTLPAGL